MTPIKIMLNGLPGNVTTIIAGHLIDDARVTLLPYSLTGPEINAPTCQISGQTIALIRPEARKKLIDEIKQQEGSFIVVDFTHPTAVNDNALFYCRNQLPFVMGTTGGDRRALLQTVENSQISAVIAPNMAKPIVGFQAIMEYAAHTFPGLFRGYHLTICESHQHGKADTSGTAKAMVGYFNQMGLPFGPEQIQKERDPKVQQEQWGIPKEYLEGHAWHTYTLTSFDQTVRLKFEHNINGRDVYADGVLDAVLFLTAKMAQGSQSHVFSMIDVLKGDDHL
jgi:4-hydroxy-tetrahydrodipicolinate reductase